MAKPPADREPWYTELTVGQCYIVTEVTSMVYVGRVLAITGLHDVVLEDAAWVSETGRYLSTFLRTGRAESMEIEPVGIRSVHYAGWSPWPHSLFTERV
jgi:hypothetical protein